MKRLFSAIVCLFLLAASLGTVVFAASDRIDTLPLKEDDSYILGDANSDGAVNALDSYTIKLHVTTPATEVHSDAADINADGVANSKDVFYLKASFVNLCNIDDMKGEYPVHTVTIADFPIATFDIVVPADTDAPNSNAYLSATIFKTYIKKITGTELSIVYGETTKAHGIYYHHVEFNSDECNELKLGKENYIYKVKNGDLHIYGSVRGCAYATYEILENYMGLRFFSDKYTFVYNKRYANIPEGTDVYYEVPYEFRFSGGSIANPQAFYSYYYALKCNSTCIWSGGDEYQGYFVGPRFMIGHSFGYYKNMQSVKMPTEGDIQKRLNDKYSESLKLPSDQNWQPCCTNNEDYYRMFNGMLEVTQMMQTWGMNRYDDDIAEKGSYAATFSINDSLKSCTCSICRAKAEGRSVSMAGDAETVKKNLAHYSGDYEIGETKRNRTTVTFKKECDSGLFLDFCNRAAVEISTEYHGNDYTYGDGGDFPNLEKLDPEVRTVYDKINLNMIIYNHGVPETVRPVSNIQIMYVSHGCYNHVLGSGECGNHKTVLDDSNKTDEYGMVEWGKMCNEAGASIWYYSHGINYACCLAPSPNVTDFYYNAKFVRECGFNGILFECDGYSNRHASFENLKAYLSTRMSYNPDITYEEFTDMVKEYMYMYYGDGYEEVYQYMLLQTAAGDAAPCWTNNHDRPFDQYEPSFIKEHYEEMRNLLLTAIDKADGDFETVHCKDLLVSCDFLGLSACYKDMYTNGNTASRAEYEKRYTDMYNYIKDNNLPIYSGDIYPMPETIDFSKDPMVQFISFASWRGIEY